MKWDKNISEKGNKLVIFLKIVQRRPHEDDTLKALKRIWVNKPWTQLGKEFPRWDYATPKGSEVIQWLELGNDSKKVM